jgi:hypothetical protein
MSDPNETITVMVEVSETVTYSANVEMTLVEFQAWDKKLEEYPVDEDVADSIIQKYIDRDRDWQDSDNYEVNEFRIIEDD